MKLKYIAIGALSVSLLAAGCSGSTSTTTPAPAPATPAATSSNQTPASTPQDNPPTAPAPQAPVTMNLPLSVKLLAENNSAEIGTAQLSDMQGKTQVVLTVTGEPKGAVQPAHIHVGACPGVGAVKYPLSNVVNGTSTTVIDVSLDTLRSQLPLAINVHKSAAAITTYVTCGALLVQ